MLVRMWCPCCPAKPGAAGRLTEQSPQSLAGTLAVQAHTNQLQNKKGNTAASLTQVVPLAQRAPGAVGAPAGRGRVHLHGANGARRLAHAHLWRGSGQRGQSGGVACSKALTTRDGLPMHASPQPLLSPHPCNHRSQRRRTSSAIQPAPPQAPTHCSASILEVDSRIWRSTGDT